MLKFILGFEVLRLLLFYIGFSCRNVISDELTYRTTTTVWILSIGKKTWSSSLGRWI